MGFLVIPGTFRLRGAVRGFQPDGDSMQFAPDDPGLLDELDVAGKPVRLTAIGSTQLRFEGVDALELHFDGAARHQPRPLADESRDWLTDKLGLDPVAYTPPLNITVKTAVNDAQRGYILSRKLESHGRPVSFVFAGDPPDGTAGTSVFLTVAMLRKSMNYKSVAAGQCYPLFYDTLFADLRNTLATAASAARTANSGVWKKDRSTKGVGLSTATALESEGVMFPKLFRRVSEWFASEDFTGPEDFLSFEKLHNEQVQILDPDDAEFTNVTHFDNVIAMTGSKVRLRHKPEHLMFISEK
jgi:endonuclease YncB( thermonuclease family)